MRGGIATKPQVIYKNEEGKRRTKVVRNVSIFATPDEIIRTFLKQNNLPTTTYIYRVKNGFFTYGWHCSAHNAFPDSAYKFEYGEIASVTGSSK